MNNGEKKTVMVDRETGDLYLKTVTFGSSSMQKLEVISDQRVDTKDFKSGQLLPMYEIEDFKNKIQRTEELREIWETIEWWLNSLRHRIDDLEEDFLDCFSPLRDLMADSD